MCILFTTALQSKAQTTDHLPLWTYHTGNYNQAIDISSDGMYIAVGSDNGNLYLFQRGGATPLWIFSVGTNITSVAISSNGFYIVAGCANGYTYLFNRTSNQIMWNYTLGPSAILSVSITADGQRIASTGLSGVANLFSAPNFSATNIDISSGLGVKLSANGGYIISYGPDRIVCANTTTPPPGGDWSVFISGGDIVEGALSAQGDQIVFAGGTNNITYFYNNTGADLWDYRSSTPSRCVDMSADGQFIAVGEQSGNLTLLSNTSSVLWFYTSGGYIRRAQISSDGSYIAAGSWDGYLYFFDRTSSTPLWRSSVYCYSLAISSTGEYIAAGSNGAVYLFHRTPQSDNGIPGFALMFSIIAVTILLLKKQRINSINNI